MTAPPNDMPSTADAMGRQALADGKVNPAEVDGIVAGWFTATGETLTQERAAYLLLSARAGKLKAEQENRALWDATRERARQVARGEGQPFTAEELRFAATARCPCGAGLAYPKDIGGTGWWECSAILMGTDSKGVKHGGQLPFLSWEVKSEDQPSANGRTTRPASPAPAEGGTP